MAGTKKYKSYIHCMLKHLYCIAEYALNHHVYTNPKLQYGRAIRAQTAARYHFKEYNTNDFMNITLFMKLHEIIGPGVDHKYSELISMHTSSSSQVRAMTRNIAVTYPQYTVNSRYILRTSVCYSTISRAQCLGENRPLNYYMYPVYNLDTL